MMKISGLRFSIPKPAGGLKILLILLYSAALLQQAYAQAIHTRGKENFNVHEFHLNTIELQPPTEKLALAGFKSIAVIDARPDTGHIGFMQKRMKIAFLEREFPDTRSETRIITEGQEQVKTTRPTIVTLSGGNNHSIQAFVDSYATTSKSDSLPGILMVVKKLWMGDEMEIHKTLQNNERVVNLALMRDSWTSGINASIEFYLVNQHTYYALYRYDSVISKAATVSEYANDYVALTLQSALKKLTAFSDVQSIITRKRPFTIEQIQQRNETAFNFPIIKDSLLRKGVYKTFDEFKDNRPAFAEYTMKNEKLADILYVQQADGKESVERDVWGYCDGTSIYIKSVDNFFLLQQCGNAFYIYGAKRILQEVQEGIVYGTSGKRVKVRLELKPFQLDWTDGKLY